MAGSNSTAPAAMEIAAAATFHEYETFGVVFAQHPDGSGFSLELQLADSFDGQDLELGMDTYCLVTSDGPTHYGGVSGWRMEDGGVEFRLDDQAAEVLGLPAYFRFDLTLSTEQAAGIGTALARILGDSGWPP